MMLKGRGEAQLENPGMCDNARLIRTEEERRGKRGWCWPAKSSAMPRRKPRVEVEGR